MKHLFFYLFAGFLLFAACKKYPEGGFVNRGPKNMLGEWTLQLYEVNGVDSTEFINYNGDDDYKKIVFKSDAPRDKNPRYMTVDQTNQRTVSVINSNLELEVRNENQFQGKECAPYYFRAEKCYRVIFCPEGSDSKWTIQKLTSRELTLAFSGKNEYKIMLKQ